MAIKIYQNLICQVKEVTGLDFGIMDESGLVLGCSDDRRTGQFYGKINNILQSKQLSVIEDGVTYLKIYIKNKLELIAFIDSDTEESAKYLSLVSVSLANMKSCYDEKYDRGNFIKNILLGNILPGEVLVRAKELHLTGNVSRVAFLIKIEKEKDIYAHDIIMSLFPNKLKDYVVVLDDESTVLIRELKSNSDFREIEKTARVIVDTLSTELMVKVFVGIGTEVDDIREIGRSYKEAQMALLVGSIFDSEKPIVNYNSLGIGRLIYQLPTTLCKLFLKEVFKNNEFIEFDTETILTIQKFFENDLNISETSRELYVHRNTLVYRLDKIQKMTGLDLRKFDDAIILKVALMVKRYLEKSDRIL